MFQLITKVNNLNTLTMNKFMLNVKLRNFFKNMLNNFTELNKLLNV